MITLGIIGVVAAITMPTLVANYKKQVYVNQLKKTYSILNQGFKKFMVDNDCVDNITECNFEWNGGYDNFVLPIKQGFDVVDYDSRAYGASFSKDFTNYKVSASINPVKYDTNYGLDAHYAFLLKDGSSFFTTDNYIAYHITADVNGKKGPNVYGRDIFEFTLLPDGSVAPYMSSSHLKWLLNEGFDEATIKALRNDVLETGCGKYSVNKLPDNAAGMSGVGTTCADRIIYEGWKMNY